VQIAVGDVLIIDEKQFRIICLSEVSAVLCQMEISRLNIVEYDFQMLLSDLENGEVALVNDTGTRIVDISKLSPEQSKMFTTKKTVVTKVAELAGPDYRYLIGYHKKPEIDLLLNEVGISRRLFWQIIRRYLQSGMKDASLLPEKRKRAPETYLAGKKRGAKGTYGVSGGCAVDENVLEAFAAGLEFYKSGRAISMRKAYDKMNGMYFSTDKLENGVYTSSLLPEDQRPSFRQFKYYCQKHTTKEEMDAIKTSKEEQRNDMRLLLGEASSGIEGPGEKVECDAVEFDVSLTSIIDPPQSVGRPIVYVMRDVLTRVIVAISVAFDNNSMIGLTSLFLNLGDDKREYCRRFGIDFEDPRLWPSNFIPQELYADRGPEFKSDAFGRLCKELGITRHLVSGASGSLKGTVESWFHKIHSLINTHTEEFGLIEKRYDSEHHKQSKMNVNQFTGLLISFVLLDNQMHMNGYMRRIEEIQNNVDATPVILWEYYCRTKGAPRPIQNRTDYLYRLLMPIRAKISRRGIELKKLCYFNPGDRQLKSKMYSLQNKKETIEVRYDPRDNSRIFYLNQDNELMSAELNENIGWMRDIKGMTWKDTEEYLKCCKMQNRLAVQRNDEIRMHASKVADSFVDEARRDKTGYSNTKNMREAREAEKQLVSRNNSIVDRLPGSDNAPQLPAPEKKTEEYRVLTDEEYFNMVAHFDEYE